MTLTPSVDRIHIALLGRMNAGKSTLLNVLTQSNTSIADATPGTTADAKVAFMQLHGLGPARLFDCAGMDEIGRLGLKKLQKTLNIAARSDIILHVVDGDDLKGAPFGYRFLREYEEFLRGDRPFLTENLLEALRAERGNVLTLVNAKNKARLPFSMYELPAPAQSLVADFSGVKSRHVTSFIADSTPGRRFQYQAHDALIPPGMKPHTRVLLITPLDAEAPKQHLLRPQAMALEAFLSHKCPVELLNLDCAAARAKNAKILKELDERLERSDLVITDSQAIDIVQKRVNDPAKLSTFSIYQAKYLSGAHFAYLLDSLKHFDAAAAAAATAAEPNFRPRVLIAEACTHDRLTATCEDIGTKQIPELIKKKLNGTPVFSFGKDDEIIEKEHFDLAVHCGGCMISRQQMQHRIRALRDRGVPCTNYGMFLTWARGGDAAKMAALWK